MLQRRTPGACLAAAFCLLIHGAFAQSGSDLGAVPPPPPGRSSAPARPLAAAGVVAELRKGGYVLYFRHAATDFSRNDAASRSDDDCANQRNLSEKGRAEARAIGRAFAALRIPVGEVLASPMCRTMETARLVAGKATPAPEVRGLAQFTREDPRRYEGVRIRFVTPRAAGDNLIVASHGNPFHGVAGPPYLAEGELAVIRPTRGDFAVIARVRPADWQELLVAGR